MWTDLAEQIVKLDQVDNLFEPKKRGRPPVSGGDEGLVCDTVRYQRSRWTGDSRWRTALSAAKWLRTSRGWVRLAGRIDDEQDIDAGI